MKYTKIVLNAPFGRISDNLPDTLLHVFMCDVAERALSLVPDTVDGTCHKALSVKRLWIENNAAYDEELEVVREVVKDSWPSEWEMPRAVAEIVWVASLGHGDATTGAREIINEGTNALCMAVGAAPGYSQALYESKMRILWRRLLYLASLWDLFGEDTPRRVRVGDLPLEIQE